MRSQNLALFWLRIPARTARRTCVPASLRCPPRPDSTSQHQPQFQVHDPFVSTWTPPSPSCVAQQTGDEPCSPTHDPWQPKEAEGCLHLYPMLPHSVHSAYCHPHHQPSPYPCPSWVHHAAPELPVPWDSTPTQMGHPSHRSPYLACRMKGLPFCLRMQPVLSDRQSSRTSVLKTSAVPVSVYFCTCMHISIGSRTHTQVHQRGS